MVLTAETRNPETPNSKPQTPNLAQLAHGTVLSADAQHTFRFVLHVDPKTQRKPVCPTVAISGAYEVPAVR